MTGLGASPALPKCGVCGAAFDWVTETGFGPKVPVPKVMSQDSKCAELLLALKRLAYGAAHSIECAKAAVTGPIIGDSH